MPCPRASRGFTLIEVSLAIVIGVVVLAGSIVIYNQVRDSVATGRMKEKVMTAAMVIEEITAQTGSFPNPAAGHDEDKNRLFAKFEQARADDYDKSPWGGQVGADALPHGITPYWMQPYDTLPVIGGPTQLAGDGLVRLEGDVQYFALGVGGTDVMMPNATGSYYDKTRGGYVTYRGWVVSGVNPNNLDGWFVYGPKP